MWLQNSTKKVIYATLSWPCPYLVTLQYHGHWRDTDTLINCVIDTADTLDTRHLQGLRYGLPGIVVVSFQAIHSLKNEGCHTTFPKSESIRVRHPAKAVSLSQALGLVGPPNVVTFFLRTSLSALKESTNDKDNKELVVTVLCCSKYSVQGVWATHVWGPFLSNFHSWSHALCKG